MYILIILSSSTSRSFVSSARRFNEVKENENVNPKLSSIVDQISSLSLLEAADLVTLLKVCVFCFNFSKEKYI